MNQERHDTGTMHRRTQWLRPNECAGQSCLGATITNRYWIEKEAERLREKGFQVEIRTRESGMMAIFADSPFISCTSNNAELD